MLTIGKATAKKVKDEQPRFRGIIWGIPGCGKTVLAYTAPKPILGIQWDSEGSASVRRHDDIHIIDLSGEPAEITEKFKLIENKEYKQIEQYIIDNSISTVVFDSCTTFGNKALLHAVSVGNRFAQGKEHVSHEKPGFTGYGIKNMLVNQAIMNLLTLSVRTQTHLIVVAHEDLPDKDKEGHIIQQTIMLGSSLAFQIPVDFSEVWHMSDIQGKRTISIRPRGHYKPIKTRMFDASKTMSFNWNYDQKTEKGDTIDSFYTQWKNNGFNKISAPTP